MSPPHPSSSTPNNPGDGRSDARDRRADEDERQRRAAAWVSQRLAAFDVEDEIQDQSLPDVRAALANPAALDSLEARLRALKAQAERGAFPTKPPPEQGDADSDTP